mgnify:CR=1 FL=1|tara:strand:+ start:1689 stop:2603 length:915 start_codon:yes stop_codon:yes gene_type:complete
MSTISTTNFEAGETTDRTDANNKFSAVATATGSINEENVRSEGIDKRQLTTHAYSTGRMEPLVYLSATDNLNSGAIVDTTYSAQNGTQKFELNGGTPGPGPNPDLVISFTGLPGGHLAIASGDLIRIHYTIYLKKHSDSAFASCGDNSVGVGKEGNPADGIGLVIFPTWKLTGAGTHEMLTNEVNLVNNFGPSAGVTFNNSNAKTDSISFVSMEGQADSGDALTDRMVHGSWSHIATQAYTVYELRLYGRGPMVYQGDRQLYVPTWQADRYAAGLMEIPYTGAPNFDFTMSNGQLSIMVMRGDS